MGLEVLGAEIEDFARQTLEDSSLILEEELTEVMACRIEKRKNEKRAGKLAVKRLLCQRISQEFCLNVQPHWLQVLADQHPVRLSLSSQIPVDLKTQVAQALGKTCASIAHSGDFVLAAAASSQIGVDLEVLRDLRKGTIRYFCSEREVQWVEQAQKGLLNFGSEISERLAPLVIFTQKEAILKAEGTGVAGGFSEVCLPSLVLNQVFEASYQKHSYEVLTLFEGRAVVSLARAL